MTEETTDGWRDYLTTAFIKTVGYEEFAGNLDTTFATTMDRLWENESARAVIRSANKAAYIDIKNNEDFFSLHDT